MQQNRWQRIDHKLKENLDQPLPHIRYIIELKNVLPYCTRDREEYNYNFQPRKFARRSLSVQRWLLQHHSDHKHIEVTTCWTIKVYAQLISCIHTCETCKPCIISLPVLDRNLSFHPYTLPHSIFVICKYLSFLFTHVSNPKCFYLWSFAQFQVHALPLPCILISY